MGNPVPKEDGGSEWPRCDLFVDKTSGGEHINGEDCKGEFIVDGERAEIEDLIDVGSVFGVVVLLVVEVP